MKYICYLLSFVALVGATWQVVMNNQDTATHFILLSIFSIQLGIFWKKPRLHFRSVEVKRKPIVLHVPKIVVARNEEKNI